MYSSSSSRSTSSNSSSSSSKFAESNKRWSGYIIHYFQYVRFIAYLKRTT